MKTAQLQRIKIDFTQNPSPVYVNGEQEKYLSVVKHEFDSGTKYLIFSQRPEILSTSVESELEVAQHLDGMFQGWRVGRKPFYNKGKIAKGVGKISAIHKEEKGFYSYTIGELDYPESALILIYLKKKAGDFSMEKIREYFHIPVEEAIKVIDFLWYWKSFIENPRHREILLRSGYYTRSVKGTYPTDSNMLPDLYRLISDCLLRNLNNTSKKAKLTL